jgi:hypothetical protein
LCLIDALTDAPAPGFISDNILPGLGCDATYSFNVLTEVGLPIKVKSTSDEVASCLNS